MGTQKYILYCATSCWSKSLRQMTNDRETILWNSYVFSLDIDFVFIFSVLSLPLLITVWCLCTKR